MKKNIYIANCTEDGEKFIAYFKTKETAPLRLQQMGAQLASTWGAKCASVTKYKPEVYAVKLTRLDSGLEKTILKKDFDNAKRKAGAGYDIEKFYKVEPIYYGDPADVTDCDVQQVQVA